MSNNMQKIINNPSLVVDQMLEGFVKANSDLVSTTENERVLKYKNAPVKGKVGVVTGGGSGHKPAFVGYIGRNMVDAVAVGELFSSPPAQMFYDAIREADAGAGVAILYGNYAGDNMNVAMAIEQAEDDGIVVGKVVANDDVPSAPSSDRRAWPEKSLCGRSEAPRLPWAEAWRKCWQWLRKPLTIQEVWVWD